MAAGAAAAAAVGTSLAAGSVNLSSVWTILNTFQLLVVVGMLDIALPPKVEAFIHGFDFASLNVPDEYNIALIIAPRRRRDRQNSSRVAQKRNNSNE